MSLVQLQKQSSATAVRSVGGAVAGGHRGALQPCGQQDGAWPVGVTNGRGWRAPKASRPRAAERGGERLLAASAAARELREERPAGAGEKVLGHLLLRVLVILRDRSWGPGGDAASRSRPPLLAFPLQALLVGVARVCGCIPCRPSGLPGRCQSPRSFGAQPNLRGLRACEPPLRLRLPSLA